MKYWITAGLLISVAIVVFIHLNNSKYPMVSKLKTVNGYINHPTYGKYSQKVEYYTGMTIMPGQTATITIAIPIDLGANKEAS